MAIIKNRQRPVFKLTATYSDFFSLLSSETSGNIFWRQGLSYKAAVDIEISVIHLQTRHCICWSVSTLLETRQLMALLFYPWVPDCASYCFSWWNAMNSQDKFAPVPFATLQSFKNNFLIHIQNSTIIKIRNVLDESLGSGPSLPLSILLWNRIEGQDWIHLSVPFSVTKVAIPYAEPQESREPDSSSMYVTNWFNCRIFVGPRLVSHIVYQILHQGFAVKQSFNSPGNFRLMVNILFHIYSINDSGPAGHHPLMLREPSKIMQFSF